MSKFEALLTEASLAVEVLLNDDATDMELLPTRPVCLGTEKIEELARLWAYRGLRWVGTIGIVRGRPRVALAEDLDHQLVFALSAAFLRYCKVLFADSSVHQEAAEIRELCRVWWLEDRRLEEFN